MNTPSKILVCLQLVVFLLMVGGMAPASADSPIPKNKVPLQVEITTRRLTDGLKQQGYEVAPGYFKLYRERDCPYSYEVLHSCLGNNPAAPYVLPIVPPWPDEWVDPATANMVGPTVEGYNASYRLDPREAIVILGQLPPPARYFGLQTYLLSRPGEWDETSDQYKFVSETLHSLLGTFFIKLPKNDERLELFADLSDPINNVVIEKGSDEVWDQKRYFVITPDKNMDDAVRQALSQLGIADNDVFTQQIPSMLGDTKMAIGLDEGSDDFLTVLRYAMPDDGGKEGTPSHTWREALPLEVLRIRDTRPAHQPQPYPWVDFEARSGTTPPETDLASDLITLAKAVCSRWGQPCNLEGKDFDQRVPPLLNMQPKPLLLTGPECVKVGMNCIAPNEDAAYFMGKKLPFPDDRVYALVGALGTQTGNATYVGLGLNSSRTQLGFDNIDDDKLAGTANAYDVPNHELFFLQYFARDCLRIKELTEGSHCSSMVDLLPRCYDIEDPNCEMLSLSVRNYLLPDSRRGPAPELTLSPRLIPLEIDPETPDRLWFPLILL
jgi:hypothetical protein